MTGTGQQIKAAAIAKAKSAVNSATNGSNGSASKKRRGNNQLKPIITTSDSQQDAENVSSVTATNSTYVHLALRVKYICITCRYLGWLRNDG
jgi:transcription initiation factor TFIID subunit TAF12